jgi:RNA polymerase sigma-70 factor (ECF subfamily)
MAAAGRTRDELLAMRCQLGEPLAFQELVEAMERRLFYYIRRFLDDDEEAADVLQEVWLTVFQKVRRLKDAGALRPWIYRIAHDCAISRFRHNKKEPAADADPLEAVPEEVVEPDWDRLDARRVHEALSGLSATHREALVLYFIEGMTYDEIAQVTGASLGLVKSRLHYAKKSLRALLESGPGEGVDA